MTSTWQMRTNAENAKKSTGPRTAEGKERARRNALKHGLTARVALLPEEDVPDVKLRMIGVYQSIRPANGLEAALAENVSYSFVRRTGQSGKRRGCAAKSARVLKRKPFGSNETFVNSHRFFFGRRWGGRPLIHSRNKKAAHRLKLAPRLSATVATIRRSLSDALKRVHAVASGFAPAGMSWVHFSKMD